MTQPNVLLIVTDHWPAALLGSAGHPAIHTPVLDQLARNGIRYTNCYSETPVCLPARRTMMTGCTPRQHGDRTFQPYRPMEPNLPTLAQSFRDAGYQAYGVGKTHTYPQRDRIGFDDIQLDDEGRTLYGVTDDYETFLGDEGYLGQQFGHGMSNNAYQTTPWHLPERLHATNWATDTMARYVRRRDPNRPSFWYLGYRHPHPPRLSRRSGSWRNMPMSKSTCLWRATGPLGIFPTTCKACRRAQFILNAKCVGPAARSMHSALTLTNKSAR